MRLLCLLSAVVVLGAAERIDHAGRVLPPTPIITTPVLFNTAQADAIMASLQIMPRDSAWNERVDDRPLLTDSAAMIARIAAELASDRRTLRAFAEMNFVIVPADQPRVDVHLFNYPDESDDLKAGSTTIGSYPFPATTPIEGWPAATGGLTLAQWQEDVDGTGGDRHAIVLQPSTGLFWETWLTRRDPGATPSWQASNGARWDLSSNDLRPAGWTSADAAGLPMLPGVVRYDECQRGAIEHALRIIVKHTRRAYLYPATHHASVPATTDPDVPAMGQRLRLRGDLVIPDSWSAESRAVASALQRYGALVADNGNFLSISVTPDDRWPDGCFDDLRSLAVADFEVVQGTGATEGPRAPGAPRVDAGADRVGDLIDGCALSAVVTGSGDLRWQADPHWTQPGGVGFVDASKATTRAVFTALGTYRLLVSVDDGVHTPAWDALQVVVEAGGGGGVAPDFAQHHVRLGGVLPDGAVAVRAGGVPAHIEGGRWQVELPDDVGTVLLESVAADGSSTTRRITLSAGPAGGG